MRGWLGKRSGAAFVAVFAILLGLSALRAMDEPDIWFQLLAGRWALDHGSVPHADFIGYVAPDAPQVFGGWGFGGLYELAIRGFGLAAASWLNALIWGSALGCALMAGAVRARRAGSSLGAWGAAGAALAMCALWAAFAPRMGMRAESTLVLAWLALDWIAESALEDAKPMRFWIAFPLAAWALAWLHTGGFVLLALGAARFLRAGGFSMPGPRIRGWLVCLAAAAALPLANPNGALQAYGQVGSIWESLARPGALSIPAPASGPAPVGAAEAYNPEYLPVWSPQAQGRLPGFALLFMLTMCAAGRPRSKGSRFENLLIALFLAMAAARSRGVGLAAMALAAPAIEAAIRGRLGPLSTLAAWPAKAMAAWPARARAALGWSCAGALACAPLAWASHSGVLGVQGRDVSGLRAAAAVKAALPHGGALYSAESGYRLQYILGPAWKVSPVSHELLVNKAAQGHYRSLLSLAPGWPAQLAKADAVCLPLYLPMPGRGQLYALPSKLAADPLWRYVELGGWPCDLFERVGPKTARTDAERAAQLVAYLRNLAAVANMSALAMDDAEGERVAGSALMQAKALEAVAKAMAGSPAR